MSISHGKLRGTKESQDLKMEGSLRLSSEVYSTRQKLFPFHITIM